MLKKILSVFLATSFVTPAFAELTCDQLEERIVEAQTKINSVKVDESSTIGDYIDTLKRLDELTVLGNRILDAKSKYKGEPEKFVDAIFNQPNTLQNPDYRNQLTSFRIACNTDDSKVCSAALMETTSEDIKRIKSQADRLKQGLSAVNQSPSVVSLVKLSQSYASEYQMRKCTETDIVENNSGIPSADCPEANIGKIDRFGSDVMDVIINSSSISSNADRKQLCKNLTGTEYNLAGCVPEDKQCAEYGKKYALKDNVCIKCTGSNHHIYQSTCYTCPKNHEVVNGVCKKSCSGIEIRQSVAPYECLVDEASKRAENLRKQESKKRWGKVLRTSAIVAVAGGAAVGLAFAFKAIFKNYFNGTHITNYNTYTGDINNYRRGAITNNYDNATNNYDNSSSTNSNWSNYYSIMGMSNGSGYNPYYQNYGYYNPYGTNPYGWY